MNNYQTYLTEEFLREVNFRSIGDKIKAGYAKLRARVHGHTSIPELMDMKERVKGKFSEDIGRGKMYPAHAFKTTDADGNPIPADQVFRHDNLDPDHKDVVADGNLYLNPHGGGYKNDKGDIINIHHLNNSSRHAMNAGKLKEFQDDTTPDDISYEKHIHGDLVAHRDKEIENKAKTSAAYHEADRVKREQAQKNAEAGIQRSTDASALRASKELLKAHAEHNIRTGAIHPNNRKIPHETFLKTHHSDVLNTYNNIRKRALSEIPIGHNIVDYEDIISKGKTPDYIRNAHGDINKVLHHDDAVNKSLQSILKDMLHHDVTKHLESKP